MRLALCLLLAAAPAAAQSEREVGIGWTTVRGFDPFTPASGTSFTTSTLGVDGRFATDHWLVHIAADALRSRQLNFDSRFQFGRIRDVRIGVAAAYANVTLRHQSFSDDEVTLSTRRDAKLLWGGMDAAWRFRGAEVSLLAAAGSYHSRYVSEMEVPPFADAETLGADATGIMGFELKVRNGVIRDRVRFGGSVRYLRILGGHTSWVPESDLSASATLEVRVLKIRGKPVYIGGRGKAGPSGPGLLTNSSFSIRGTVKFK